MADDPVAKNLTGSWATAWKWTRNAGVAVLLFGAMAAEATADPTLGAGGAALKSVFTKVSSIATHSSELGGAFGNTWEAAQSLWPKGP